MIGRVLAHVGGALVPIGMGLAAVYVVKPTVAAVGLVLVAYGYGVMTGQRAGTIIQEALDDTRPYPRDDDTQEFTLEHWDER